jgi:aconitate decarboxylase
MNVHVTAQMPDTTRVISEFATKLRYEDLPKEVIDDAKRCIIDSLGCGLFGAPQPWTQSVARVVASLGQAQKASASGSKLRADPQIGGFALLV